MIKKNFADFFVWYDDGLEISQNRGKTDKPCLIVWYIKSLNIDLIDWNASSVLDYKIWISPFWNIKENFYYSMWIIKTWEWNWIDNAWLLKKINWKSYMPQLWDNLVAKINPENNYINELFLMNWKSWNEINDFVKTLNLPYCSWNTITQELEKNPQNNSNYYLFWSLILALIIIWVLVFKLLKFKK